MPSTQTSNVALEKQATGENDGTWGVLLNAVLDQVDRLTGGRVAISVAGGTNVTLTAAQYERRSHELTGLLTGNIDVIYPANGQGWLVYNNTTGSFTLTAKTSGGTGIIINQGDYAFIQGDATNIVSPRFLTQDQQELFQDSTGSANAYVLTLKPALRALRKGQRLRFKANFSSTGASTLAVSGLAATSIMQAGAALASGAITSGDMVTVDFDGTNFELQPKFNSLVTPGGANTLSGTNTIGGVLAFSGTNTATVSMPFAFESAFRYRAYETMEAAGTMAIGTTSGNRVLATNTGTTTSTIVSFGTADAGAFRKLRLQGGPISIVHGTAIVAPGAASYSLSTCTGQTLLAESRGSGVWEIEMLHTPPATATEQEAGASAAVFVTPAQQHRHDSAVKFWVNFGPDAAVADSYNVTDITDTATGNFTVNIATDFSGVAWEHSWGNDVDTLSNDAALQVHILKTAGTLPIQTRTIGAGALSEAGLNFVSASGRGDQ